MESTMWTRLATEAALPVSSVRAVVELLDGGATVPFIARYRKEATGSLDEVQIADVRDRLAAQRALDERRAAILKSLTERDLLTDALAAAVAGASTMAVLEDVYLPYRPKRRTRAQVARERGLEPLAEMVLSSPGASWDPLAAAAEFIDEENGVATAADALAGARDIVAERVSEDAQTRGALRTLFMEKGVLSSRVAKDRADDPEAAKFRDWFDWSEPAAKAAGHRVLALFRGEREGVLKLTLRPPEEEARTMVRERWVKTDDPAGRVVAEASEDAYDRLLAPSLENETRAEAKERADAEAIRVFAANLRELLLAPPLGRRTVMGLDPGFRTGCKLVVLDPQGKLLHHDVVYPTQSAAMAESAARTVRALVERFGVEAVAIGNGTASRETEAFARGLGLPSKVAVVVVNESGASVYSASAVAREEFPDQDVTVRGAVSIGRRLMDPLAELVKIDPKAIGVGQYQHDVEAAALKRALDDVVMACVNAVGVDVNTASRPLLAYVSGLGPALANNIVKHRDEHGPFASRAALKKVPRLGPKAFEQAAGFLRIRDGAQPLDASAVHPERYALVKRMADDVGADVKTLLSDADARAKIRPEDYVSTEEGIGLPTLRDIVEELAKPGRDPRDAFEVFSFAEGVAKPSDLSAGMVLPGIVTNVTSFGAFIDVGVHQDGLAHISELSDRFVRNPADVVKAGQRVTATVLSVDLERNRIALSLKSRPGEGRGAREAERGQGRDGRGRTPPPSTPKKVPPDAAASGESWLSRAMRKS